MPRRRACVRAARSRAAASSGQAPNLPDRSDLAGPAGSARRMMRPRSSGAPVSSSTFSSSVVLSITKSRTPWALYDSAMARRDFTGCMKCISASGNRLAMRWTSGSDAQSKWRTPPSHSACSTAGSGLHLTAYIVTPGKPVVKAAAFSRRADWRRQVNGSCGRNVSTRSSISGRAASVAGANGTAIGAAARRARSSLMARAFRYGRPACGRRIAAAGHAGGQRDFQSVRYGRGSPGLRTLDILRNMPVEAGAHVTGSEHSRIPQSDRLAPALRQRTRYVVACARQSGLAARADCVSDDCRCATGRRVIRACWVGARGYAAG